MESHRTILAWVLLFVLAALVVVALHVKPAPSPSISGASGFVVSCGVRLSEVGLSEIRKPQVIQFLTRDVILLRLPS